MFHILFSTAVKYKGDYYLSAQNISGLFKHSERKNELSFLMPFKDVRPFKYQFVRSFIYKNEAWFIPQLADKVAIVNLEDLSVEYLNVLFKSQFNITGVKYISYCIFEEHYVCFAPQDVDAVNIIDLETHEITAYYDAATETNNYSGVCYADGKLYFYPWRGKQNLIINWHTGEKEFRIWDEGDHTYGDVYYDRKRKIAIHAPVLARDILVEKFAERDTYKIAFGNTKADGYLTYYISKAKNDEIIIWCEEKDNVIKMNLQDMSYSVYEMKWKGKNKYLFPVCSDDSSNGSEALLYGGSKIVKYMQNEMRVINIPVGKMDMHRCLAESRYTQRDLYGISSNDNYREDWLFCIGDYIEMIKLT